MDRRRDQRGERRLHESPTIDRHLDGVAEQRLGGRCSEADDDARMHYRDLRIEPWAARADLAGFGFGVNPPLAPGFPLEMFDDVRDVGALPRDSRLRERLVQDTPGRAD